MTGFGGPRCTECNKVLDLNEYVEVSATLIRLGASISLGTQMYCTDCFYEMDEDDDGKEKDGS